MKSSRHAVITTTPVMSPTLTSPINTKLVKGGPHGRRKRYQMPKKAREVANPRVRLIGRPT
jgi:hypothetical protein